MLLTNDGLEFQFFSFILIIIVLHKNPLISISIYRFSPSGSVLAVNERYRSKSESPWRMDEPKQPSSQVCFTIVTHMVIYN